jgi:hypothetical protein
MIALILIAELARGMADHPAQRGQHIVGHKFAIIMHQQMAQHRRDACRHAVPTRQIGAQSRLDAIFSVCWLRPHGSGVAQRG